MSIPPEALVPMPIDEAARLVCEAHRTTMAELTARHGGRGTRRRLRTVGDLPALRASVWWHLRQVKVGAGPKWSYPDISRVFNTGHSTIMDGVRRHEEKMRLDQIGEFADAAVGYQP